MSAAWAAGGVRARAMSSRRLGTQGARRLVLAGDLDAAVARLAEGPYGHDVHAGQDLAAAQHAVAATYLWHLRVLAGWLPRQGVEVVRLLAGWAELANVETLLRTLGPAPTSTTSDHAAPSASPPYVLGSLATVWPRLEHLDDRSAVRRVLGTSPWGDPGTDDDRDVVEVLRLTWAARVAVSVPVARAWARGAAALVVAHDLAERQSSSAAPPSSAVVRATGRVLGPRAAVAETLPDLASTLDRSARWALEGADDLADLWRCEIAWWRRVQRDALALRTSSQLDLAPVVGVVASLAVDAWATRAALTAVAHGTASEVLDALA